MNGFLFSTPNKEFFFATEQTRRTPALVSKIDNELKKRKCEYRGTFGAFPLKDLLWFGTCEIKHTERFGDYYDIKGDGWGGHGSFVSDGKTEIIHL